jgi:hypothetical protein
MVLLSSKRLGLALCLVILQLSSRHHVEASGSCDQVDSVTFYKYQQLALGYFSNIDDIANMAEDVDDWYDDKVAPYQSNGIKWSIVAGDRISDLDGAGEVSGLFASLATREFSFHQWSHWTVCRVALGDIIQDIRVSTRYHGVVREENGNNEDIFGNALLNFKVRGEREDLITEVKVLRIQTISRPFVQPVHDGPNDV